MDLLALTLLLVAAIDPRVEAVLSAMSEPGCPRLAPMLNEAMAQALPAEKRPGFCQFVGRLEHVDALEPRDGWLRIGGSSRGRRLRVDVAFDERGKVAGLRAVMDDAIPDGEAKVPLEEELEQVRARHKLPALAALVLRDGEVIAQAAAGVRKLGAEPRATVDDRWHLGSDTKAMTATLAAMLVDEQRLRWTSTVADVFSDWKDLHPELRKVTLEMLLAHRAGLPAALPPSEWSRMWKARDQNAERTRAVHALLRQRPGKVGEYLYSNFGYLVAGAMIEKVTGQPWEAAIRKRLFEPLKMASCGFGAPASPGKIDQPWAHVGSLAGPQPVPPGPQSDNPPSLGPAGTVHCGLRDWARFAQLHLDGAHGKTALVSAASMTKLHTPWPDGDYALGWIVERRAGFGVMTHDGSNTMFHARVFMVPEKNLAFLIATNAAGDEAVQAVDRTQFYLRARYLK